MKNICLFTACISVMFLSGCSRDAMSNLDKAESYMEEQPEQALALLEDIDMDMLATRKARARHALLYSMALDKNYIDLTNDSIINVAVNFYRHNKDKEKRFMAYYYQARIYENAGNYESAMASIARAEKIRGHIDKAYVGRLLLLKESIYGILLEYDKAISTALEAAKFSMEGNKPGNYHQAILNVARYNLMKNNISETDKYLNIIKEQWDNLTLRRKHTYYDIKMLSYIDACPDSSLVYLTEYLNLEGTEDFFNWRTISHVYEKNGLYHQALQALDKYEIYHDSQPDAAYYLIKSHIYEGIQDYKNAYEAYKQYIIVTDSTDMDLLGQDTRFIEERYDRQITIIHQKIAIACILAGSFIVALLSAIYINRKRRQTDHLKSLLAGLRDEHNELLELQKASADAYNQMKADFENMELEHGRLVTIHNENKKSFEDAQKILDKRIQALGTFLSKDLPDSISKVAEEIEDLTNNRYLIADNIGMLYAIYHPNFVGKLAQKGLTASEIGYCCLLLLGLKTTEVGSVICRSGAYNMSSGIRNKLQLTGKDTRLAIWLRNLFKESEIS